MKKKYVYKNYKWLMLSFLLTLLDIGVKYCVTLFLSYGEVLPVLPGLNFYYIHNTGLALGLFSSMCVYYPTVFVYLLILVISIFIIIMYKLMKYSFSYNLPYIMIIGGALGNLFDRLVYGSVIDFIDLYIGVWHWPVFNVADIEISIGVVVLMRRYYFKYIKIHKIM